MMQNFILRSFTHGGPIAEHWQHCARFSLASQLHALQRKQPSDFKAQFYHNLRRKFCIKGLTAKLKRELNQELLFYRTTPSEIAS